MPSIAPHFRQSNRKLEILGRDTDLVSFLALFDKDKFPLNNLSFLLIMKTVRFFSKQHTSEIFSRNETILENWKPIISWNLSLYMSDPRNVGQAKECSSSGKFVPRMCKYKFRCNKHSNAVHIQYR